jgi:phosphoglycolate phosphatase-like HAD superfamily hydrolase
MHLHARKHSNGHGHNIPFERVRTLIGTGGDQIVPEPVPGTNNKEGEGEDMADRRSKLFLEQIPGLKPINEARQLRKRLQQDSFTVVAASSVKREELEQLLKVACLADLIDAEATSSDAEASKPDISKAALNKAGQQQPDEAVLLGDSPFDIEPVRKAGVRTIALRSGGFSDDQLKGALAIYDDPANLLAHSDESPLTQPNAANT